MLVGIYCWYIRSGLNFFWFGNSLTLPVNFYFPLSQIDYYNLGQRKIKIDQVRKVSNQTKFKSQHISSKSIVFFTSSDWLLELGISFAVHLRAKQRSPHEGI